jgi:hypothetical protein
LKENMLYNQTTESYGAFLYKCISNLLTRFTNSYT